MNLKQLREKRNNLFNELDAMVTDIEGGEVRSLTADEIASFDAKKAEIEQIDQTIIRVEEMRNRNMAQNNDVNVVSHRDTIADAEVESRAIENFFRGLDLDMEQRRMLTTTSGNTALIPSTISKTVLQHLEEQCPILAKARRFSTKGALKLIDESSIGEGGLTAENTAFKDADVTFNYIELRAYKVSASVSASFEMLANSEIDLGKYLLDIIVRRLAKELNKLFLVGTGSDQPQGLINGTQTVQLSDELTINDFITMQTAMNPSYLDGADWIVNRETFQKMANLLDNVGRPYLTSNVVGEKIQYRLLGNTVIVDQNMQNVGTSGNKAVLLANIKECYAVNVLQDMTVKHLTEKGFTEGYEQYAGYILADGKIYNNDSLVVGKSGNAVRTRTK